MLDFITISDSDAEFLSDLFSSDEYDLYFAENTTTINEWKDRINLYYKNKHSFIIKNFHTKIGWIMFEISEVVCEVDIIVLKKEYLHKGYGRQIFDKLVESISKCAEYIILDVQERNSRALSFYIKYGFSVVGNEMQCVGDCSQNYIMLKYKLN